MFLYNFLGDQLIPFFDQLKRMEEKDNYRQVDLILLVFLLVNSSATTLVVHAVYYTI